MKYPSATAFRAALEARLKGRAEESGASVSRLRKFVVFDRLLARLVAVAPGRWVLKGALALQFRLGTQSRTTKDIDIGRADDESAATDDFIAAQELSLDDYFNFTIERTGQLDELDGAHAIRYYVVCELAGRTFDEISVDVVFGGTELRAPDTLSSPSLLAFADIEPVQVPAIPLARHIAEKVHAYTRAYGSAGRVSSRVKDLVDLALIASEAGLDAADLRNELNGTFSQRKTHQLPEHLPKPPADWTVPYKKLADEVGISAEIGAGHEAAASMLDPVLTGRVSRGSWKARERRWTES